MQVHFDLRDVLRCHAVTFMSIELETTFTAAVDNGIDFNVVTENGLPSHSCWADITSDRDIVNWLIDHRVPFRAS
jgi:hypothetical protein